MTVDQFKALGDPVRWAIIRELRGSTCCARRLADAVSVSPTLLSHHLKVLREAGLIAGARRGRWIDYTVDETALAALAGTLNGHPSAPGDSAITLALGTNGAKTMTDESRIDEEYEPADIDPDDPISTLGDIGAEPPVEADPADWVDQHIDVPEDDEERG